MTHKLNIKKLRFLKRWIKKNKEKKEKEKKGSRQAGKEGLLINEVWETT